MNEPFGPTVFEWKIGSSPDKEERLHYLCELLGISTDALDTIRY
ncbi:MAG: hypothetical protein R3231_05675 [bacterium]|nr:hypothetical protein [bacterium]